MDLRLGWMRPEGGGGRENTKGRGKSGDRGQEDRQEGPLVIIIEGQKLKGKGKIKERRN